LQRLEIVPGALLGYRARKDRNVAAAIVVLVFDASDAPLTTICHQPNISMEILLDGAVAVALVTPEPLALGRVHGGDKSWKVRGGSAMGALPKLHGQATAPRGPAH